MVPSVSVQLGVYLLVSWCLAVFLTRRWGGGGSLFCLTWFQIDDGSGMKREATVDEVIKIVEELTRIH